MIDHKQTMTKIIGYILMFVFLAPLSAIALGWMLEALPFCVGCTG